MAVAVYLPWVLFAWAYYGSPVPNTILAKAAGYGYWWARHSDPVTWLLGGGYNLWTSLLPPLGPAFAGNGTNYVRLFDPGAISGAMMLAIVAGVVAACRKGSRELRLMYAFFWVYVLYYAYGVPMFFGWYGAPLSALAILLAAHGIGVLLARWPSAAMRIETAVAVAYLAIIAGILPLTFHGERNIQRLVEERVRIAIGKYLHEHSPPNATAGGEPLGYIGYYSRRAYYDYPGLASRRVVDFLRAAPQRGLTPMLEHFAPDYIVLRDPEVAPFGPWLARNYRIEKRFEVPAADRAKLLHPERNIDLAFTLFRRRASP
jgi:hypothetical protein